jgi:hypothetical protein
MHPATSRAAAAGEERGRCVRSTVTWPASTDSYLVALGYLPVHTCLECKRTKAWAADKAAWAGKGTNVLFSPAAGYLVAPVYLLPP